MSNDPATASPTARPDPNPSASRTPSPNGRRKENGEINAAFLTAHKIRPEDGPDMYKTFQEKKGGCVKIVINP